MYINIKITYDLIYTRFLKICKEYILCVFVYCVKVLYHFYEII